MNIRIASTAVAAAAGAVLLTVAPAATAAAPAGTPAAPAARAAAPLHAEVPVSVKGVEMTYQGQNYTFDLTGKATLDIEAPTPGNLTTKVTGSLSVAADNDTLGRIEMTSTATGTAGFNSLLQPFPAKLELSASGSVSIQNLGATAQDYPMAADPTVLHTKAPAQLTGTLNQFPPRGTILDLANPVELAGADSDATVATVSKFPVAATGA